MKLKAAVVGLAALGGVALTAGSASAIPNGLPGAARIASPTVNAEQVRWVCDAWGRCWWRRPVWGVTAWGPRPVWGPRWRGAYAWGPRPWGPPPWGPGPWGRRW
ncbi:hypothetical protein I6F35_10390 [Bradyrhizobium sp. BRP22]|uniref:hypothetical protein n=1 Tax=Bradyrhizobium sp. BRP22 TaxID=2793821 RepID=UPI001CD4B32E|nr:hypothetical protein [Bradyrhizobium sp. BRP22]MCA1453617.1 hypothetical protein [Bradyrhizobium sp. BRP22]